MFADSADTVWWGVQNYGKHADIILERSLMGGTDKVGADRLRSQVGGG